MGRIIWIFGIVCTVLAIVDVFKKDITTIGKIIMTVLLLLTSWIGLILYYFWAKNHITEWFK